MCAEVINGVVKDLSFAGNDFVYNISYMYSSIVQFSVEI